MIVADASVILDVLRGDAPDAIVRLVRQPAVASPDLVDAEICSALRRLERQNHISTARAEEALDDLGRLRLVRHPARTLVRRAWDLRHNITVYDALYLALAEVLHVPLATADRRLERAAQAVGVDVV